MIFRNSMRVLALIIITLVVAQAQVDRPVIINRFSLMHPVPSSDPVFITDDKCVEYSWRGYASFFGQLSIRKRINLLSGMEIGFGFGFPYTVAMFKTILHEYGSGTLMMGFDFGLMTGWKEYGIQNTLGKVSLSYGDALDNGINRKIEIGYSWYSGFIVDLPQFPRSQTIYARVGYEKTFGKKITLNIFCGPALSDLRYRPPQDSGYTLNRWGNIRYIALADERRRKDKVYDWSRQWGISAGIIINYKFL